ncbi:unnamed protein product [Plutella xylostella]|uniref:(diamondback moth) hypothetical protein n=1 Tax=Plutella xylostella TaxID=51655 RepID=A0A8S4G247_PLUXY|nr:unnamed protein product [Plutella xylostella]
MLCRLFRCADEKVAAWSKPVSRAGIDRRGARSRVSSTDLSLFAATEGLRPTSKQPANTPPRGRVDYS